MAEAVKRHVTECVEPEALTASNPTDFALFSIAVSLKRIADAVAGDERNSGLVAAIYDLQKAS